MNGPRKGTRKFQTVNDVNLQGSRERKRPDHLRVHLQRYRPEFLICNPPPPGLSILHKFELVPDGSTAYPISGSHPRGLFLACVSEHPFAHYVNSLPLPIPLQAHTPSIGSCVHRCCQLHPVVCTSVFPCNRYIIIAVSGPRPSARDPKCFAPGSPPQCTYI